MTLWTPELQLRYFTRSCTTHSLQIPCSNKLYSSGVSSIWMGHSIAFEVVRGLQAQCEVQETFHLWNLEAQQLFQGGPVGIDYLVRKGHGGAGSMHSSKVSGEPEQMYTVTQFCLSLEMLYPLGTVRPLAYIWTLEIYSHNRYTMVVAFIWLIRK